VGPLRRVRASPRGYRCSTDHSRQMVERGEELLGATPTRRVAAEIVSPYPPGVPVLTPGRVVTGR